MKKPQLKSQEVAMKKIPTVKSKEKRRSRVLRKLKAKRRKKEKWLPRRCLTQEYSRISKRGKRAKKFLMLSCSGRIRDSSGGSSINLRCD
jgi:hypothetical protein